MMSNRAATRANEAATRRLPFFALVLAALLSVFCGRSTDEVSPGGETHFLMRCSAEASACATGLVCLCGVCTRPCGEQSACEEYRSAECVSSEPAQCGQSASTSHCDVLCERDSQCRALSASHRCEGGACRAARAELTCSGTTVGATEVLFIGDRFFAAQHQITAYVEELARSSGALSPGERYRDNSRSTGNALALLGNGIADQYRLAASDGPVKIVIMNGGGADVFGGACEGPNAECPIIVNAANAARELLAQMAADGVLHVIYAFYPDPLEASLRAKMDALRPAIQAACEASPVPCHWLDLREAFAGKYPEFVEVDGIHPTAAGSQASATEIWSVLRQQCLPP